MTTKRTTAPARPRAAKTPRPSPATRRKAAAPVPEPAAVPSGATHAVHAVPAIDDEQIRIRAYFLSLERQGRPGDPMDDWLAAEREFVSPRD
jgi:hypothetical protein